MQKQFDIQRKFRFIVYVLVLISLSLMGVSSYIYYESVQLVELSKQKIYVLDNGKSLLVALREDISENRDAEARDHVKRFHELFFTLEPDKTYIENNVREALYLADRSAMEQYQAFKENNLYNQVIASDISMTLQTDSIKLDFSAYPYHFTFTGRQKIVRKSNITIRSLKTSGYLRNISRTDNNPHGFLMESWRIDENKDLESIRRKSF
ncbi:Bacteroides conjugative transposon TraK protein [Draconibacterium orientale]|uniref:Bacteroides conjugative transposon TraK protein n=1 Tax=Draconibacterium orientale TaxID=1168034 RepID=X5DJA8_9BACT|nr:conjugative transposon protein TraK [Draconibacterium orientale]AHW60627.1 conjugal transfer protein [Draconibacterium orientale]SET06187.1 Bacteroides conjugative transposon TraK protein [Draconibacterium orientale]